MNTETQKDNLMRRYLLGEMSDEERSAIEEQFLENDDFFEEIAAFEDELFYEYKQNRLTASERIAFEEKFLKSAQDREKAAFAEAFLQTTEKIEKEKSPSFWQTVAAFFNFSNSALRVGVALGAVLVVFAVGFLVVRNSDWKNITVELPKNINTAFITPTPPGYNEEIIEEKQKEEKEIEKQIDEEKQKNDGRNVEKMQRLEQKRKIIRREIEEKHMKNVQPQTKAEPRKVLAVSLLPGLFTRSDSEGGTKIKLSPETEILQMSLSLKNQEEYKKYRVSLSNIDGGEIWTGESAKISGKGANRKLSLSIPAKNLKRADYELTLSGIKENGETEEITVYYFTVLR